MKVFATGVGGQLGHDVVNELVRNPGTVYQRGQTTVNLGTLYSEEEKLA